MVVLKIYLLIYLIVCTLRIYVYPEYVSAFKICIASLFYPFSLLFFILNIPLSFIGVYLEFKPIITVSNSSDFDMTDNEE
jgi:hypothetical protein